MKTVPYNRYRGNSGQRERVEEPVREPPEHHLRQAVPTPPPLPAPSAPPPERRTTPPPPEPRGELGQLLRKLTDIRLETEDLHLLAVLYLLYRETRDEEFLIMMAGIVLF